ncbi:MAG: segregation/condensation protein A [Verrucomicrobiales bacterium]|nr:segregation/condensation protein A [Verrucomicrobiales bacterium]
MTETEPEPAPEESPSPGEAPDPAPAEREGGVMPEGDQSAYKIALEIFEGPMDLLLYLIKRDEIDIYDIPIERITKQYMEYLDTFKLLNIGVAGEFLVMAANLCYIKSRLMLPKHVQPPDEEADEDDPRWDLIRQLIEYKKFKEAAHFLGEEEAKQQEHFVRKPDKIEAPKDQERPLSGDVGVFDLIKAFQNILDKFEDNSLGEIVDDHYTVSDKIDLLLSTVEPGGSIAFSSLFENASSKHEMIVTFLAVLELMKLNYFQVRQEIVLGEIELRRNQF